MYFFQIIIYNRQENLITERAQASPAKLETHKYYQDYINHAFLAKGSFATVYSAVQKITGSDVAIKVTDSSVQLKRHSKSLRLMQSYNEQVLLARLSCIPERVPNVVGFIDSWVVKKKQNYNTSPKNEKPGVEQACKASYKEGENCQTRESIQDIEAVFVALELCKKGSLLKLKGKITDEAIKQVLKSMSSCLKGLHELGLVHMDIKPENILVTSNKQYRLADWGSARERIRVKGDFILEGDARYLDQELLDDHKFYQNQNFQQDLAKSDVFSLGLTLYELITGIDLPEHGEAWQAIRGKPLTFPDHVTENFSTKLLQLLQEMTRPADQRPTFDQILKKPFLRDPALTELLWQELLNKKLSQDIKELMEKSEPKTNNRL